MPYEVVAFAAASMFLAIVTAMLLVGALSFFGALRCGACVVCRRWRILAGTATSARCFRCEIFGRLASWHSRGHRPFRHGHRLPVAWHH